MDSLYRYTTWIAYTDILNNKKKKNRRRRGGGGGSAHLQDDIM